MEGSGPCPRPGPPLSRLLLCGRQTPSASRPGPPRTGRASPRDPRAVLREAGLESGPVSARTPGWLWALLLEQRSPWPRLGFRLKAVTWKRCGIPEVRRGEFGDVRWLSLDYKSLPPSGSMARDERGAVAAPPSGPRSGKGRGEGCLWRERRPGSGGDGAEALSWARSSGSSASRAA